MRPFTYQKPESPVNAVRAIAAAGTGTRFLAGGTTLYDLMKLNVEVPSHIVDINSLSELQAFDTFRFERACFWGACSNERRRRRSASHPRLSRAFGIIMAGGIAAAAQHGEPWRQSAPAHALRLLSGR